VSGTAGGDGEVRLVLDSLHSEAGKWRRLSDDMAEVDYDASVLTLHPTAFFFADVVSVTDHSSAYNTFHDWFTALLADARTEFGEIAQALDKSADAYANADTRSSVDLKSIYGTRPEGN